MAEPTQRIAYSVAEVCAMLGMSKGAVYNRIRDGRLPVMRFGGRTLIMASDLEAALASGSAALERHHVGAGRAKTED